MKQLIIIVATFLTIGLFAQTTPTKKVNTVTVKKETTLVKDAGAVVAPKPKLQKFKLPMKATAVYATKKHAKVTITKDNRQK